MCVIRTAASQKNIVEGESLVSQIEERVGLPIKNKFYFFFTICMSLTQIHWRPHTIRTIDGQANEHPFWGGGAELDPESYIFTYSE